MIHLGLHIKLLHINESARVERSQGQAAVQEGLAFVHVEPM